MSSVKLETVRKALYLSLGAPTVKYNGSRESYIVMSVFFRALGKIGSDGLVKKIKGALPDAEVLNTWTTSSGEDSFCGREFVEFKLADSCH
jgi:hypothetical protein